LEKKKKVTTLKTQKHSPIFLTGNLQEKNKHSTNAMLGAIEGLDK